MPSRPAARFQPLPETLIGRNKPRHDDYIYIHILIASSSKTAVTLNIEPPTTTSSTNSAQSQRRRTRPIKTFPAIVTDSLTNSPLSLPPLSHHTSPSGYLLTTALTATGYVLQRSLPKAPPPPIQSTSLHSTRFPCRLVVRGDDAHDDNDDCGGVSNWC